MVYETFLRTIKSALEARFGSSYSVTLHRVAKNNNTFLDGLSVRKHSEALAPAVYLNIYYESFLNGVSLDDILNEIQSIYINGAATPPLDPAQFQDFALARDYIAYKLIHAESNRELLADIPHKLFLDLAVVFYLYMKHDTFGQVTALVYHEHMETWGTNAGELYRIASLNTPRLLPAKITNLHEVMKELIANHPDHYRPEDLGELLDTDEKDPLFVLSNSSGIDGSCCMLYPDRLRQFAGTYGCDVIILPSSIHEVLLMPNTTNISYRELGIMVTQINQTEVPREDQLSNQVYVYSLEEDSIAIASQLADIATDSPSPLS